MNKNAIKIFAAVLMFAGCNSVNFLKPTQSQSSLPQGLEKEVLSSFDSKDLPTGAKAKMTLGKDSTSEYGEVAFNHDTHSFNKYSPDGKTDITCAECHHTDQPKSALKPPLVTSERNEVLTADSLKKPGAAVVKGCRTCHFQEGNAPEGKEMPTGDYKDPKTGKVENKELTNELAYHINCNICHDKAAALRPELKKKPGFAVGKDCLLCHQKN